MEGGDDHHHKEVQAPPGSIVKRCAKKFMDRFQIPGMAVALYVDDAPYLYHFGFADRDKKIPVTDKTIFEIGSISKVFTCILFAQEVIDGKMNLDDPITRYVKPFSANKKLKNVTLERLATHTSSLPYDPPAHVQSRDALVKHVSQWMPRNQRFEWSYSNHGVELLAIAIEEKYKKSVHELFIDKILKPLNMEPIGVWVPDRYKKLCSSCYAKDGSQSIPWSDQPYLHGSGLLHASNVDMLNFLKASLGLPGTPDSIKQAMQFTQKPYVIADDIKQGLGWQIDVLNIDTINKLDGAACCKASAVKKSERIFNGDFLFDKTGTTQGFHSYIAVIPNKKIGVVVMINKRLVAGFRPIKKFGRELLTQLSNI